MEVKKFILGFTIAACVLVSGHAIKKGDTPVTFRLNSADFAFKLYSEIEKSKQEANFIIAPFSIQTALGMVYFGSSGETSEEFENGIKLISNQKSTVANSFKNVIRTYSSSPILHIANKVFVNENFEIKPEFQDIAKNSFYSEVENVDFSQKEKAASTINDWVDAKTNHKIKEIIDASTIDESAQMILLNAVHFKADWAVPFDISKTKKEPFHHSANKAVDVDMMTFERSLPFKVGLLNGIHAEALELPYKNSDFSMLFVMPQTGHTLEDVEGLLQNRNLLAITDGLQRVPVKVKIPKFKIEFNEKLNQNLYNLGLKRVFEDSAQLDGIFKGEHRSKISQVIHKTFIEVDETGTEAAAATEVLVILGGMFQKEKTFYADRPFLFAIKDKAAIHFIGRYTASEYL